MKMKRFFIVKGFAKSINKNIEIEWTEEDGKQINISEVQGNLIESGLMLSNIDVTEVIKSINI